MATSPPAPSKLTLSTSKKRPSTGPPQTTTAPGYSSQAVKRLKHQHPLRQTSFPATEAQAAFYTPTAPRSENGSVSASLVSGISGTTGGGGDGGGKRSRGRPKKRKGQPHELQTNRGEDDDGGSTILSNHNNSHKPPRGRGAGTKSILSGTGQNNAAADHAAEEDDDDAAVADPNSDEARRMEAESKQDKEKMAILIAALAPAQMDRYLAYSRTKLKMPTLKRIVNQTVSQSVTAGPLSAVQWMGKVFVGEMVELARDVREEWAAGWERAREEEKKVRMEEKEKKEEKKKKKKGNGVGEEGGGNERELAGKLGNFLTARTAPKVEATQDVYVGMNPHRGGLLPDHLREALRRYKASGEGGGTGLGGFSFGNLGVKGEAVPRLDMGSGGGKRLFR